MKRVGILLHLRKCIVSAGQKLYIHQLYLKAFWTSDFRANRTLTRIIGRFCHLSRGVLCWFAGWRQTIKPKDWKDALSRWRFLCGFSRFKSSGISCRFLIIRFSTDHWLEQLCENWGRIDFWGYWGCWWYRRLFIASNGIHYSVTPHLYCLRWR